MAVASAPVSCYTRGRRFSLLYCSESVFGERVGRPTLSQCSGRAGRAIGGGTQVSRQQIVAAVWELVEPIVAGLGLELVDVSYGSEQGRWILRLTIDGPGGVTLDDCQRVSEAVDGPLDEADPIPGSYYLEVSSPGLDRPLVKPADYVRFAGRQVRVRTVEPIDGRRNWQGRLDGLHGEDVLLTLADGRQVRLPLAAIGRARLVPEFV